MPTRATRGRGKAADMSAHTWVEQNLEVERWRDCEADVICPVHDDAHASASVNVDKRVWNCHACGAGGTLSDLARDLGVDPPEYSGNGQGKREVARYDYCDAAGKVLYQVVRFEPGKNGKTKDFRQFNPATGEWRTKGLPRVPYRLPEFLEGIKAGRNVFVVEGEKDVDTVNGLDLVATCNQEGVGGRRLWGALAQFFPPDAKILLVPDADQPGQDLMQEAGRALLQSGCQVKIVDLGYPISDDHGKDITDWITAGHSRDDLVELAKAAPVFTAEDDSSSSSSGEEAEKRPAKMPKQADVAVELGSTAELFHDGFTAYARIEVNGHNEVWKLRGREFKTWLRRQFYQATATAIGSQALEDALGVLEGKGLFEGPEITTHVRIAGDDSIVYLDLGDDTWRVVRISAAGWEIMEDSPVRFRRPPGMLALPMPVSGGGIEVLLDAFLNMAADDRKLFAACLVNAFRPRGPYPVLCLHGEQGSAKSTAARIFRSLIDPNTAALRSTPREERDLLIAGTNGWVVAFDNLSHLPTWVSDALCRIATGSGFGVRQLYADDAEILFQVQRPVVLNGIEDLAARGDLLDRSVLVYLPAIPEDRRLPERNFNSQFEEARPRILGALLDVVSGAIRNLGTADLSSVPRMADFAEWVCAAESALGWEPGTFLEIYRANRADANSLALEATPIVPALTKLLEEQDGRWSGTATDLHEALSALVSEKVQRSKAFPKSGRSTSASLKRLAPNLRVVGIWVDWERSSTARVIRLKRESTVSSSFASLASQQELSANDAMTEDDAKTQGFTFSLNALDRDQRKA